MSNYINSINMKKISFILLLFVTTNLCAKNYIFTSDEKFITSVADTLKFDKAQIDVYRNAKLWLADQKWSVNISKDSWGESLVFDCKMTTKSRYNPFIRTSYSDFITFIGYITIKGNRLIVLFDNIQFGEEVSGVGPESITQPLSQKVYQLEKTKKARQKIENDLTMDAKLKKEELAKLDDKIKDIEKSLNEVDEELRLKIQLLKKEIE